MKVVKVDIQKPLYGTYVTIREETIDFAIKTNALLEIHIPQGVATVDPLRWKRDGKRMTKVFLYPDRPMVLYGGHVPLPPPKQENKLFP